MVTNETDEKVLAILRANRGRWTTGGQISVAVGWPPDKRWMVAVVIKRLRRRFGEAAVAGHRNRGYRLATDKLEEVPYPCVYCGAPVPEHYRDRPGRPIRYCEAHRSRLYVQRVYWGRGEWASERQP